MDVYAQERRSLQTVTPKNPKQQVGTDQVPGRARTRRDRTLEVLLLAYLGASLLHFVHNAEYVQAYPNLPGWITRFSVYGTWIGITAGGLIGYVLYRFLKPPLAGLIVLCLYAAAGLDGLLHYLLAPMSAHTHGMNFAIWFEVLAASILLAYLVVTARKGIAQ
jgi:hypothetical protein